MTHANYNILDYIVQQSGAKPKRQGNKILLDPCPICKVHKGHFYVYLETNSYYSFSGCCKGGSIIDAMILFEGISLAEAIARVNGDFNPFAKSENIQLTQIRNGLSNWRNKAYDRLCIMFRATQTTKKTLPPDSVGFFAACEFENILDYWTDTLNSDDEKDWLQVYREIGEGWGY